MGGKGKGGKGKKKRKQHPSGPTLERERITEVALVGKVVEWKGKFGWIQPEEPFHHEKAKEKHGGKIWFSKVDVVNGVDSMAPGTLCEFHVYADAGGIGAEQIEA